MAKIVHERHGREIVRHTTRPGFEDYPLLNTGHMWRSERLDWMVANLTDCRAFRHLTDEAIRSYLLYLAESDSYRAVRSEAQGLGPPGSGRGITSRPPFFQTEVFRRKISECETCGHCTHKRVTRQVLVAPDAPARQGREIYANGLRFDWLNTAIRVAWRLGVSCFVCGSFLGARRPQKFHRHETVLGSGGDPFYPLCDTCAKNEKRDIRKWQRQHGYNADPPEEWLLLRAVERARKAAA